MIIYYSLTDDESNQSCTPTAHDTIIELFLRFINSEVFISLFKIF